MNKDTAKQLGRTAGKLLLERLAEAPILDDLYSRIVATMPTVVQEAQAADFSFSPMFQATDRHNAMCFACARLAFNASTIFTERPWREFIEGVLESAVNNTGLDQPDDEMRHLATRADIIENINDHEKALARLCRHYPPEAKQVLIDITDRMEPIVSDVLAGVETEHHTTIPSLVMFLVLFLFCLGATLLIGFAFPVFLVTTLALGLVGFRMGKSTKVPADPREVPFSPMLTLSYREFDRWARQKDLRRTDPAFFSRTDVHWTEKLPVLFSGSDAAGHCFEPSRSTTKLLFVDLALGAYIFFPAIHEAFGSLGTGGALFFQFMCGLALGQITGRATGEFYRWFRGKL